jgi:hypothetical protein
VSAGIERLAAAWAEYAPVRGVARAGMGVLV